jgi:TonB family protein
VVDATGQVDSASIVVVSSTHKAFELPAVDVLKGSHFRPAMLSGVPRAVRIRQPVEFHIMKPAATPSTPAAASGSVDTTLVFLRTEGPTTDTLAVVVTPGRRR